jgi:hypothetical protein
MLERLYLKNVGPAPEMDLEVAPRLNLLTGDNGLGKSFLLDIVWWVLTRRWPAEVNRELMTGGKARPTAQGTAVIEFAVDVQGKKWRCGASFNRQAQEWKVDDSGWQYDRGLVLYAQMDGSFSVWDPARNQPPQGNTEGRSRPPAYVFSPGQLWDGLRNTGGGYLCNGLIADWAGWQKERGAAFERLAAVLTQLSPDPHEKLEPGELTRISLDDVRDMPTVRMPYGDDVPLLHASAGIRRIAALAYLLVWAWEEHTRASKLLDQATVREIIFLIDEIESHLHPRWQRTIVRSLLQVVNALSTEASVQLIAATHSPLVMASVEPYFDPSQDAWFDLDLVRRNGASSVQLKQRTFVRHGEVSNWLTSEAFDLGSARSVEAEQALARARLLLGHPGQQTAEAVREVDAALRGVLTDIDPFWVRWSAFAEPYLEAAG